MLPRATASWCALAPRLSDLAQTHESGHCGVEVASLRLPVPLGKQEVAQLAEVLGLGVVARLGGASCQHGLRRGALAGGLQRLRRPRQQRAGTVGRRPLRIAAIAARPSSPAAAGLPSCSRPRTASSAQTCSTVTSRASSASRLSSMSAA